ncbi:N-acetylmuramoyl-L-alanine amidase family protein [Simkania sp.]|uniref:N-acetylmuramoyl-L-alanine amidase family protein n=1 Tax=Simkania sp. TaxID=34094 RepID=UPI003B52C316
MRFVAFLLLFTVCSFGREVNFHNFDGFQQKLSKEYVTEKIRHYLKYSDEIEKYYEITANALAIYASPGDKKLGKVEYALYFGQEFPSVVPEFKHPLSKAKIAIDPGHFGGQFARLEERYVSIESEGKTLEFDEGTLAFLTALHLKKKLEAKGATVLMTRKAIGEGAYPQPFFEWLKEHPELWEKGVPLSTIFLRHYNRLDLRARAELINNFQPDLTLLIHYNAIDSELPDPRRTKPTKRNFNLVFIPGAFCKGELANAEDRYHFLRLICTQDLELSHQMAQDLVERFTTYLDVPPLKSAKKELCGFGNSLVSADGVFCRNLCLTRLIESPLCYGETLIQNNLDEALELSQSQTTIDGIPCPQRVIDVAEAYYKTILLYYEDSEGLTSRSLAADA